MHHKEREGRTVPADLGVGRPEGLRGGLEPSVRGNSSAMGFKAENVCRLSQDRPYYTISIQVQQNCSRACKGVLKNRARRRWQSKSFFYVLCVDLIIVIYAVYVACHASRAPSSRVLFSRVLEQISFVRFGFKRIPPWVPHARRQIPVIQGMEEELI
ncbi:hypothetical protein Naga_100248g7 [Nannochloropsis gaditana]|uniref:Uncharacterized protein n=1 Tax=Nannochloropsis gaditana TaxID=72520 RepID=W7U4T5_9STRA|nr:hypothetical protein Naga_100248g7 [Nannochloropsis gaditana]